VLNDQPLDQILKKAIPTIWIQPTAVGAIVAREKIIHGPDISMVAKAGWIRFDLTSIEPTAADRYATNENAKQTMRRTDAVDINFSEDGDE
jgi:hypothetical protein